jgi:hypothetical protein
MMLTDNKVGEKNHEQAWPTSTLPNAHTVSSSRAFMKKLELKPLTLHFYEVLTS